MEYLIDPFSVISVFKIRVKSAFTYSDFEKIEHTHTGFRFYAKQVFRRNLNSFKKTKQVSQKFGD